LGDGYNRRFGTILVDFERKERIVDDNIHYDEDLEEHWWRTIDFLSTASRSGIVLNPEKFQFAQREVNLQVFILLNIRTDLAEPIVAAAIRRDTRLIISVT